MQENDVEQTLAKLRAHQAALRVRVDGLANAVSSVATQDDLEAVTHAVDIRLDGIEAKVDALTELQRIDRVRGRKAMKKQTGQLQFMIRKTFRDHEDEQAKTRRRIAQWALFFLGALISTSDGSPINLWALLKALTGAPT